jgi:hypothetical protein
MNIYNHLVVSEKDEKSGIRKGHIVRHELMEGPRMYVCAIVTKRVFPDSTDEPEITGDEYKWLSSLFFANCHATALCTWWCSEENDFQHREFPVNQLIVVDDTQLPETI